MPAETSAHLRLSTGAVFDIASRVVALSLRYLACMGRTRGVLRADSGASSLELAAAVGLAGAVLGAVLAIGVPESVSCAVQRGVAMAVPGSALAAGAADSQACASGGERSGRREARLLAASDAGGSPLAGGGPLATAALLERADSERPEERCLPAVTGATTASLLCLAGGNTEDPEVARCTEPTGSASPVALACAPTSEDPRTGISTVARDGQVAWCQPVRTGPVPAKGDLTVEWACASWAGDVFFCPGTVSRDNFSRDIIDRGDFERVGWAQDRASWPTTCDSRTLGDATWATCELPAPGTGRTACSIPAITDEAPARPVTCITFTGPPEQTTLNHVINKPLHCSTRPDAVDADDADDCGSPEPGNPGRQLNTRLVMVRSLLCRPEVDVSRSGPSIYSVARYPNLAMSSVVPDVAAEGARPSGGRTVAERYAQFFSAVTAAAPGWGAPLLPTFIIGPGLYGVHSMNGSNGTGSALYITAGSDPAATESYRRLAEMILESYGLTDLMEGVDPGLVNGLAEAVAAAAAGSQVTVPAQSVSPPGAGQSAWRNQLWMKWVYSNLQSTSSPETVTAVMVLAMASSDGTSHGFFHALLPAVESVTAGLPTGAGALAGQEMVAAINAMAANPPWEVPPAVVEVPVDPQVEVPVDPQVEGSVDPQVEGEFPPGVGGLAVNPDGTCGLLLCDRP